MRGRGEEERKRGEEKSDKIWKRQEKKEVRKQLIIEIFLASAENPKKKKTQAKTQSSLTRGVLELEENRKYFTQENKNYQQEKRSFWGSGKAERRKNSYSHLVREEERREEERREEERKGEEHQQSMQSMQSAPKHTQPFGARRAKLSPPC